MNKIVIQGRLTRDPEVKDIGQDLRVWRISVAVDRRKSKDGTKKTDFFTCDAWGKTGDTISQYFHKGDGIILFGRMESNRNESDGKTLTYWNLNVEEFDFPMARKTADAAPAQAEPVPVETPADLPF
jgi:single-strand DNA-binding protein